MICGESRRLFLWIISGILLNLSAAPALATPPTLIAPTLIKEADHIREEKSYQLALDIYKQALTSPDVTDKDKRELKFKIADCAWRTLDETLIEDAKNNLRELSEDKDHDLWWAEANESLAEFYLTKDRWSNAEAIKQSLAYARDYWAGVTDLKLARARFIKVSFTLGDFVTQNWGYYYQDIRSIADVNKAIVPPTQPQQYGLHHLYEEIIKVAQSVEDKGKATYALAMCYLNQNYNENDLKEAVKNFQKVIKDYPESEWLDDAYFQLGQLYERQNDFLSAVAAYRDLTSKFARGDSQFVDNALSRIKEITSPALQVSVGYTFLPDSEVQFNLGWRNIAAAQINFYKLDLVEQLRFNTLKTINDSDYGMNSYSMLIENLVKTNRYRSLPVALSFNKSLKDEEKHLWYNENKGLAQWLAKDEKEKIDPAKGILPPGAYLLVASSGETISYDLVVVTDMGLVAKTAGHSALLFAFDAKTGKPQSGANIKLHYRYYDDQGQWRWDELTGVSDENGLLKATLKTSANRNYSNQHDLFAVASVGSHQALTQGNYYSYYNAQTQWWLYAYSDRPAYRPNEEISFKGILRQNDGFAFTTPGALPVNVRIYDPRGNKVQEKSYTLNNFGSFNDQFKLDEKATLGEYRIEVWSNDWNTQFSTTPLFRLEEYKLPEFTVTVAPKPKDDKAQMPSYKIGDEIDVEISAEYYFGGPVADAQIEYLIYQSPYYHSYFPRREYPWYYDHLSSQRYDYYDQGQLIKQEKATTDSHGKAQISFETPTDLGYDLKYRIEVRVVDQSRREIISSSEIKVTRTSYLAYLTPKQYLYRPGDKAQVEIKAMTANDEPVSVEGKISVSRNWWRDPVIAKASDIVAPGHYEENVLFTKFVKTNERGEATFEFEPEQDGFYVMTYTGYDTDGSEIKTQTSVYICDKQSQDIGYRYGGLQIIAEKDTFAVGETARVMLVSDKPDTWALFTTEAEEIDSFQLVHLEGAVKLIEIPIKDNYTPNIFFSAISASDYQLKASELQVIVPPDDHFLNVKISSDKASYNPQEKGVFDIEVTDKNGKPVEVELSLGITDSSVYYIQSEYVADIRQFFYGQKRQHSVTLQSSFYQKSYQKFVRGKGDALMSADEKFKQEAGNKEVGVGGTAQYEPYYLQSEYAVARDEVRTRNSGGFQESDYRADAPQKVASLEAKDKLSKMPASAAVDQEKSGALATAEARTDFRSTVIWQPAVKTDASGKARVTVQFPDSLTTWRSTARALTTGTTVGNITHDIKTNKDLIVRLQAPRFFTERDKVTISANVHNFTEAEQRVKVTLEAKGIEVTGEASVWVTIPAQGETRVDWESIAQTAGMAELTAKAQTETVSDAMKRSFPVVPHGIEKFIAQAVVLKSDAASELVKEFTLDLPKERIKESTSLQLILSPSLAASLLDALPYLADFPYGCVEQTMSRFLPAVIVKKALKDMGLSESDINAYISDVLENSGDPKERPYNTTVTISRLDQMTKEGLNRLYDFQHSDGGWGWWKEGDSDRFMSAYVIWGLSLAKEAGINVDANNINRGVAYLQKELVEEENNPDMLAWMLHALASAGSSSKYEDTQTQRLWEMRDKLNSYTRALFALSEHARGHTANAQTLSRNIINGISQDKDNATAHWGASGVHYRWSDGGVESTAFSIKAMANIDPSSEYLEPAVKWLALNRRGGRWKNTRDTAIAILGLVDYLKTTSELTPQYTYEVFVNGKSVKAGEVTVANMFKFDRTLTLPDEALVDGKNTVRIAFSGKGSAYLSGYLKYFTLEEDITPAGNEVFVERKYFKTENKETLLKGYVADWTPLENGDQVNSGDRIRVEITLEAKNNYEYIVAEDYKPAGAEAVELKSGSGTADFLDYKGLESGEKTWLYQEFRDQKVAFFITNLKQGKHKIVYELRAEVPGEFHGMPNQVHAMYVPEIRGNSAEMQLKITDQQE